ncbi:MAG: TonB-dependent receptor [Burkholderiales bacterium]|nr:TonB-dependent receptor [Burkholderiales bacterium]
MGTRRCVAPPAAALALASPGMAADALAQQPAGRPPTLPAVVVTATRDAQSSFDLPMAIDAVGRERIREHGWQVNVSESLGRLPGVAVQNRETYSQEQQVSVRGFGARAQFGVRGVKLLADGIPAGAPDGQGGAGLFDLGSADRIEVLRGPFSALYGNHSGGVVQVFTEDGPARPTLTPSIALGSYASRRVGLKFGGSWGPTNAIASVSRFDTDGYRQWSGARKDQLNGKLRYDGASGGAWTFVVNALDQPENLDPLGLTAAQMAQDRRQANPAALAFATRRSLRNVQAGAVHERPLGGRDTLRAVAYLGERANEQYLAFSGAGPTSSGGVSVFDRAFWGAGLRWTRRTEALSLTAGVDYERADDHRTGFVNDNGVKGALRRDEDNTVWQAGAYVQGESRPAPGWSVHAGLRYSRVEFRSRDRYIIGPNPDDSGEAAYADWTPAVGVVYRVSSRVNLYANLGRSFETPTFIELAYRPGGATGLNFDLRPSVSRHAEGGVKALVADDGELTAAVFDIDTRDEIVVDTNVGGRTTYRNAGATRRRGVELAYAARLPGDVAVYLSATWLDAKFSDAFVGSAGPVAAGNRLPGVPGYTVAAEAAWRHAPTGFRTGVEARWNGKVWVDDRNTEAAADYLVANLHAGFEQRAGRWRLRQFVRVDNLLGRRYVGAVYVNDGNGRYYAPAPEHAYLVGVSVAYAFGR